MKRFVLSSVAATSMTLGAAYAWACEGEHRETASNSEQSTADQPQAKKVELPRVSVAELATMIQAKQRQGVQVVDANGDELRARLGVIPGATLLTSATRYELSELPGDKARKLVFYCANEQCGASHQAARRARDAGYQDVAVLPAGIMGWKAAGKTTSKPSQS